MMEAVAIRRQSIDDRATSQPRGALLPTAKPLDKGERTTARRGEGRQKMVSLVE